MTQPRDPEALLSAYLADGMEVLPDRVVYAVLEEAHRTRQRAVSGRWAMRRRGRTALGAAAVVAAVAAGGVLFVIQGSQPSVADPSPPPSVEPGPSLPAIVPPIPAPSTSESAGPSAGPSRSPAAAPSATGVWIPTRQMATAREGGFAVRLRDGRVLVAGGSDREGNALTSAELYDPGSGTWSATGTMIHPPGGFDATLLADGTVLVGDATDDGPGDGNSGAEVFDPATGSWTSTGPLAMGWYAGPTSTTATVLADGTVLVAGFLGSQLFDPVTDTWAATGSMVTPRYNHAAALLPDGRVLVAGGDVGDRAQDSAEVYDPATGTWTATADMAATGNTRFDHILATLLQDGTVLVVRPSSAALYDPATGTWSDTGDMVRPDTWYGSATRLLDGTVLLAGGEEQGGDLDVAELYDPVTGSWTKTASMLRSEDAGRAPATLLLDGTVLATAGQAPEVYVPAGVAPPDLGPVPTPTPTPTPTPIPTPFPPAAGPIPANARTWTVTVENRSSEPGTLFLALDDGSDALQLCGSVTPNVVPAGVTEDVTFLLPPKRVTDCWLWLNPAPGQGGSMFQTSDAPMKGRILFTEGEGGRAGGGWLGQ